MRLPAEGGSQSTDSFTTHSRCSKNGPWYPTRTSTPPRKQFLRTHICCFSVMLSTALFYRWLTWRPNHVQWTPKIYHLGRFGSFKMPRSWAELFLHRSVCSVKRLDWIDHAERLRRKSFLIEWVVVALHTEVRRRKWTLESEWKSGVRASEIPTCRCKLQSVRIAGTIEELPSAPEEACLIDRPVEMFVNWQ